MKIIVYAICKNEETFVERWIDSMKEADDIYALDTGSTDNTIKKLKANGVHVKKKIIKPWRFDIARNESLKLVPKDTDICVCTDLDETFNKGWRKKLESLWAKDTNRIKYIYNWQLDENNIPIISFYYEKIHSRNNYKWIYPVHEVLSTNIKENYISTDEIILNHYPNKNKSRSSYLPLLELANLENQDNDRITHYLGREYMYHKRYQEAIDTLIKHIYLKTAIWKDEKSASMRFIGRCYKNIKRYDEARYWYQRAIEEAQYLRDPLVELAIMEYELKNYSKAILLCNDALNIKNHEKTYINEVFSWNETIYDILSISYYNICNYKEALINSNYALSINNSDQRLINNNKIIKEKIV